MILDNTYIPLLALYNYDPTIFDGLTLPEGINKDTLIDTIMIRGGEYGAVYTSIPFLKSAIKIWSDTHAHVIDRWLEVYDKHFEPLENYDRYEEWSDDGKSSNNTSASSNSKDNVSSSNTSSVDDSTSNVNTVSAYNSSTLLDSSGNEQTGHTGSTSSGTTSSTGDTSSTSANTGETNSHHTGHIHGNIGVTTSAKMYEEFWLLMSQYGNIYDSIATLFLQDFVIPIL